MTRMPQLDKEFIYVHLKQFQTLKYTIMDILLTADVYYHNSRTHMRIRLIQINRRRQCQ